MYLYIYLCACRMLKQWGGGSNPIFAHGKCVFFTMGKKYMEREGNEYSSLSFHILFSLGQKWGFTTMNLVKLRRKWLRSVGHV